MSGDFIMEAIERGGGGGVKASMDLVRTVMCSLLAAGHRLSDSAGGCPDRCGQASVCGTKDHGHGPLTDGQASEQWVRLLNRRVGPQTGWTGLLVPVVVPTSGLGEPEDATASLTVSSDPPELAKCWQFYWRTACEPRAPSSVS